MKAALKNKLPILSVRLLKAWDQGRIDVLVYANTMAQVTDKLLKRNVDVRDVEAYVAHVINEGKVELLP